ncbi:uncharacterized protein BYT42DRAFT_616143 [Radiomyces spectabilis]|uniref:uncharacterized protein n=1 Tax=Radiomyces spectabilis TaxID=64574 RepID=UPI0022207CD2|nr:uncharacterized protein BYT42DRAFT_616143 [Radiomyces spectabilis]KAI8372947.1 hypothetical protein BYT42DRAFT_616143 [Radiomyces spectabilis]
MPPRKDKGKQRATYVQVDPSDSDSNQPDFERDIEAAVQESCQQRKKDECKGAKLEEKDDDP